MSKAYVYRNFGALFFVCLAALPAWAVPPAALSVSDYGSIQEAIDQNPGKAIEVPPGVYEIEDTIKITADGSGLYGFGEIVQTNPDAKLIEVRDVSNVQIRDLTLRRPQGKMETDGPGIEAQGCTNLVIDGVRIYDNRTRRQVIHLEDCKSTQIRNCLVENYMRVALDDRTGDPDWGYASNAIHGTGISVHSCVGTLLEGNRIIERALVPTKEIKEKYKLGDFVKTNPEKGRLMPQHTWNAKYNVAWQQGAAIECRITPNSPRGNASDYTQLLGNYIENAAQGIDIHGDCVIVANNVVNDSSVGLKTMHGSKSVIISGNQFVKPALSGIYMSPGNSAANAKARVEGDEPLYPIFPEGTPANAQAGTVIAYNIISDFGYGHSGWIWEDNRLGNCGIRLDHGPSSGVTPVSDVLITGNVMYDPGRDGILVDGEATIEPPRYRYAVSISPGDDGEVGPRPGPEGVHFANNILHPGTEGVSNVPMEP